MKQRIAAIVGVVGLLVAGVLVSATSSVPRAAAEEPPLPGMCNGRTDPDLVVTAHANGRPGAVPKYILNLWTDGAGVPSGTMILGRGADRVLVEAWCRTWHHLPGQPFPDTCEAGEQEGATNLHAVGVGTLRDGSQVLVRTDVRSNEEGMFFRVRHRPLTGHDGGEHEEGEHDDGGGGCEDESWTRVPAEGWYPLDQLNARIP